jgi:hypothetical protein
MVGEQESISQDKALEFLYTNQSPDDDGAEGEDDWARGFDLHENAVWFEPYHLDASEQDMQVSCDLYAI